jgi:hypothetical protein
LLHADLLGEMLAAPIRWRCHTKRRPVIASICGRAPTMKHFLVEDVQRSRMQQPTCRARSPRSRLGHSSQQTPLLSSPLSPPISRSIAPGRAARTRHALPRPSYCPNAGLGVIASNYPLPVKPHRPTGNSMELICHAD